MLVFGVFPIFNNNASDGSTAEHLQFPVAKRSSNNQWLPRSEINCTTLPVPAGGQFQHAATDKKRDKKRTPTFPSREIYGCPILANEWQFIATVYSFATF